MRRGLDCATSEAVAVYMADASDDPEDLVRFFRTMQEKDVDCDIDCMCGILAASASITLGCNAARWILLHAPRSVWLASLPPFSEGMILIGKRGG